MGNQEREISSAYRDHATLIRSFIFSKTGCYHTAEDLTQEAFIRLYRADGYDQINDIKAYLFRIANNLIVDHFRSLNGKTAPREMRDITDEHDLAADAPSAEEITLHREQITNVYKAVGELSALCQRIFWLSRAHGFHNHEIASMQKVCLSTVEKNISRARRHCATRNIEQFA